MTTVKDSTTVQERVISIIVQRLDVERERVALESSIIHDLGADSLETVELMMGLEEEFGVSIPETEAVKIKTVKDIVDYIFSHM